LLQLFYEIPAPFLHNPLEAVLNLLQLQIQQLSQNFRLAGKELIDGLFADSHFLYDLIECDLGESVPEEMIARLVEDSISGPKLIRHQ
jgi:hypothetical protein